MKGIILSGGMGTRLHPLTRVTSKQLLPVYDRPMIYYPLRTLLDAGITEILIIVAPDHCGDYMKLLGSGKEFGAKFTYEIQEKPEGIAQAFLIGAQFIGSDNVALILGDNIFADNFDLFVKNFEKGAQIFAKEVNDPERFGVVERDEKGRPIRIIEKPIQFVSKYAIPGLYLYDNRVVEISKALKPSARGELEVIDLHQWYLDKGELEVTTITGKWIDAGTFESLHSASVWARKHNLGEGYWQCHQKVRLSDHEFELGIEIVEK